MGHLTSADCRQAFYPRATRPPSPPATAWERWGRRTAGALLLAIVLVATVTFGYAVVGDQVAAFCIPREEVTP